MKALHARPAVLLTAVLTMLTFVLVDAVAPAPRAHAAVIDPAAWYQLINRNSGKALHVLNNSTADGADIVQWTRDPNATNQQWQFVATSGGFYELRARHSGKNADVTGASTADGADVIQWPDNNGNNQQWSVVDTTGGYVKLLARHSGKAMEVTGSSTVDGGDVVQRTDNGGANQQWQLVPTTPNPTCSVGTPPAAYPNPGRVTGSTGAHDPGVTKTPNGTYILVTTGANLPIKTSTDRIAWQSGGSVWPGGASWTTTFTNGSNQLWAPDISFRNGQYYLYYAASTFGSQRSAIFLATSPTGASGSWTHRGTVIESSTAVNFNAIDPALIVDQQGQWWLTFGSFWTGIKMIRLDPATGMRSTTDTAIRAISQRTTASGAVEAPFIYFRCGFYYLFVSFDLCCRGAQSTYRIMVGRSTSVTGPYTDRNGVAMTSGGGTQILATHGSIHGPGHQAVIADNGQDVLFYHYYADSGASFLGINLIGWDASGWPFAF
ncbi:MAG TPA: family 43 glycosylhydrolase [Candidatus Limnocylindrales bacterium]|nr:family 43 glycosylhydrolase [Candidatus Limnocylindrales bacterium]